MKKHIGEAIQELLREDKQMIGSGIRCLDQLTGGLAKGDLIILGARPWTGREAFLGDLVYHAAAMENQCVLYFSLEKSSEMALAKNLMHIPGYEGTDIEKELLKLREDELHPLLPRLEKLKDTMLWIDDTSALTIEELLQKCRDCRAKHPLDLIVIDSLQLVGVRREPCAGNRRKAEIVSEALKQLADEMNCAVLVGSQLSKRMEYRKNPRPTLFDFESPIIPRMADEVLLLYRDFYREQAKGLVELTVAKHPFLVASCTMVLEFQKWTGFRERTHHAWQEKTIDRK